MGTDVCLDYPNRRYQQTYANWLLRNSLTHTVRLGYDVSENPDLVNWSKAVGRTATCNDLVPQGFTTPTKFPPGESMKKI